LKSENINKISLGCFERAEGMVIVIDVIRAFTTAAFAFSCGIEKIYLVGTVKEAFDLYCKMPDSLLVGESEGHPVRGFHLSNSPSQINNVSLEVKKLIMRTSCGSQGIIKSKGADHLLACSFTNAHATLEHIRRLNPSNLTFVITNQDNGDEDLALADYLEKKLTQGNDVPILPFLERVKKSKLGRLLQKNASSFYPSTDLKAVLMANKFNFIMKISHVGKNFIMTNEFNKA